MPVEKVYIQGWPLIQGSSIAFSIVVVDKMSKQSVRKFSRYIS